MAKITFKALTGNQVLLFPENLSDRIPENHPARLVHEVVEQLDISSILKQYKGGGTSSYHPRMLLKVLFYSYLCNIYSSRKIEKALQENIYFMWLSGKSTPDHGTINNFRGKRLKSEIQRLFADIVRMLQELGYVSLDVQYIDGTKIESAANRYTFVWRGSVEKNKVKLEAKIQTILSEIDDQIKEDHSSNEDKTPKPIDSAVLKEKLAELNKKLDQTDKATQKQLDKLQQEHLPRLEKYEDQLEKLGDRNSYSKTDEDATFMRLKDDHMQNGQLKPAYNAQISTENQFLTHYTIHQTAGDTNTLEQHLDGFETQYQTQSKEVVADAGYGSEENYEMMEGKEIEAYVKYNYFHKEQKRNFIKDPFISQNLYYNSLEDYYVCPMGQHMEKIKESKRTSSNGYEAHVSHYQARNCEGCPLRSLCHKAKGNRTIEVNHRLIILKKQARERLISEKGLEHRSKRPVEVEAVFGQMKSNNKFSRFTLRGKEKVRLEFGLMSIAHNLRKLARKALQNNKIADYMRYKTQYHLLNKFFENYFGYGLSKTTKNQNLKIAA